MGSQRHNFRHAARRYHAEKRAAEAVAAFEYVTAKARAEADAEHAEPDAERLPDKATS